MKPRFSMLLLLSLATFQGAGAQNASAPNLPATLLLKNNTMVEGNVGRRQAGTTMIRVTPKGEEGQRSLNLEEIDKIHFDMSAFNPALLNQAFQTGRYEEVVKGLKGRIVPYFSFSDQNTNSNDLVMLFIRALYRTGNHAGVAAARKEVERYDMDGEVRRLTEMLHALSQLDQGDAEAFEENRMWFEVKDRTNPLAPVAWTAKGRHALSKDDWATAYPLFANVVIESPLDFAWSMEALYQTARYHQAQTNLVVAAQICQEISVMSALPPWSEKTEALYGELEAQAGELNVEIPEFGSVRDAYRANDEAVIDYQQRKEELEKLQLEQLQSESSTP